MGIFYQWVSSMAQIRYPRDFPIDGPYCLEILEDSEVPPVDVVANAEQLIFQYCPLELFQDIMPEFHKHVEIHSIYGVFDLSDYEITKLKISCRNVVKLPKNLQHLIVRRNCVSTALITADKLPTLKSFKGYIDKCKDGKIWDLTQIKEFLLYRYSYGLFRAKPDVVHALNWHGSLWNTFDVPVKRLKKLIVRLPYLEQFHDYEIQHLNIITEEDDEKLDFNDKIYQKIFQSVKILETDPAAINHYFQWPHENKIQRLILNQRFNLLCLPLDRIAVHEIELRGRLSPQYGELIKNCNKLFCFTRNTLGHYRTALEKVEEIHGNEITLDQQLQLLKRSGRNIFTIGGNVFADARALAEHEVVRQVLFKFPDADALGLILQYVSSYHVEQKFC